MCQDAVTRDQRYGPLMAKRSEGRKEGRKVIGINTAGHASPHDTHYNVHSSYTS